MDVIFFSAKILQTNVHLLYKSLSPPDCPLYILASLLILSFLFRIKQKYRDVEMTIVADKFSPNTTSDIGKQIFNFFCCQWRA